MPPLYNEEVDTHGDSEISGSFRRTTTLGEEGAGVVGDSTTTITPANVAVTTATGQQRLSTSPPQTLYKQLRHQQQQPSGIDDKSSRRTGKTVRFLDQDEQYGNNDEDDQTSQPTSLCSSSVASSCHETLSRLEYSSWERHSTWYSSVELFKMKRNVRFDMMKIQQQRQRKKQHQHSQKNCDDTTTVAASSSFSSYEDDNDSCSSMDEYTSRGLENFIDESRLAKKIECQEASKYVVLKEQQQLSNSVHARDAVALQYGIVCTSSRKLAYEIALKDEQWVIRNNQREQQREQKEMDEQQQQCQQQKRWKQIIISFPSLLLMQRGKLKQRNHPRLPFIQAKK